MTEITSGCNWSVSAISAKDYHGAESPSGASVTAPPPAIATPTTSTPPRTTTSTQPNNSNNSGNTGGGAIIPVSEALVTFTQCVNNPNEPTESADGAVGTVVNIGGSCVITCDLR